MTEMTTRYPVPLMAVPEEVTAQPPKWAMRLGRALRVGRAVTGRVAGASAAASLRHVRDHAYSLMAIGSFSAAGFSHSVFTGLLVLGAGFFLLEFKIASED